jgi:hypothetical protein
MPVVGASQRGPRLGAGRRDGAASPVGRGPVVEAGPGADDAVVAGVPGGVGSDDAPWSSGSPDPTDADGLGWRSPEGVGTGTADGRTSTSLNPPPPQVVGVTPGHACIQAPLARFVGQVATQQVGADMLAASNAAHIRWASIGMMLTMEFREDRVTVRLDKDNRILAANCG